MTTCTLEQLRELTALHTDGIRQTVQGDRMTTCTPLKPFRCWQYRKGSTEPVPEWARMIHGAWNAPIIGPNYEMSWLVEFACDGGTVRWYTPAEFAERFRVIE